MGDREPEDPPPPTRCPCTHLLGAEWLGRQEAESVSGRGGRGRGQTRAPTRCPSGADQARGRAGTTLEESRRPSGRLFSIPCRTNTSARWMGCEQGRACLPGVRLWVVGAWREFHRIITCIDFRLISEQPFYYRNFRKQLNIKKKTQVTAYATTT